MDEVSARAELATVESGLTVSVPKSEVLAAVDGEGADLMLDVVRTNGAREERRVRLAWEPAVLKQLADEAEGDRVLIAIDPASLEVAFDDIEAHGLREVGATLAIAVTALGGAGGAAAAVDSSGGQSSAQRPAVEATVDTSWQAAAAESGYGVRGGPDDVTASDTSWQAAAAESGYGVRGGPDDVTASDTSWQAAAAESGYGVRGTPSDVAGAGDDGGSISAPGAGVTAALAGGAALTIAAAVFALRRRREPEPAT
jgi:hypothetical protein